MDDDNPWALKSMEEEAKQDFTVVPESTTPGSVKVVPPLHKLPQRLASYIPPGTREARRDCSVSVGEDVFTGEQYVIVEAASGRYTVFRARGDNEEYYATNIVLGGGRTMLLNGHAMSNGTLVVVTQKDDTHDHLVYFDLIAKRVNTEPVIGKISSIWALEAAPGHEDVGPVLVIARKNGVHSNVEAFSFEDRERLWALPFTVEAGFDSMIPIDSTMVCIITRLGQFAINSAKEVLGHTTKPFSPETDYVRRVRDTRTGRVGFMCVDSTNHTEKWITRFVHPPHEQ